MAKNLQYYLPQKDEHLSSEDLLGRFLTWTEEAGIHLYEAQENAILELFDGKNVILNTPTGSGKSLVAEALHFISLACGRRSAYTCPIKALVNEKWMALCKEFGPENVGLSTGDATVNMGAPILCCTAEILENRALGEGELLDIQDEIHQEHSINRLGNRRSDKYEQSKESTFTLSIRLFPYGNSGHTSSSATKGGAHSTNAQSGSCTHLSESYYCLLIHFVILLLVTGIVPLVNFCSWKRERKHNRSTASPSR